jgi:hypothetical protein
VAPHLLLLPLLLLLPQAALGAQLAHAAVAQRQGFLAAAVLAVAAAALSGAGALQARRQPRPLGPLAASCA